MQARHGTVVTTVIEAHADAGDQTFGHSQL